MSNPSKETQKSIQKDKKFIFPLEVLISGFSLEKYISNDFKDELNNIFNNEYEIRYSTLEIKLIEKDTVNQYEHNIKHQLEEINDSISIIDEPSEEFDDESGIPIKMTFNFPIPVTNLSFTHRNEEDYKNKFLVISCTDEEILDKLLKSYEDVSNHE